MEVTINEQALADAMAQALLTLMGDDREKVLAAFMTDVLNSKVNRYGNAEKEPLFKRVIVEEVEAKFRVLVKEWLATQEDALRDRIRKAITNGQLDAYAQALVEKATEAVQAANMSGKRY